MRRFLWLAALVGSFWLLSGCTATVSNAVDVSVGQSAACMITTAGAVECWGEFVSTNGTTFDFSANPVEVLGLTSGATDIELGRDHACAIVLGSVKCWGEGRAGQLGNGGISESILAVDVVGLPAGSTAVQLSSFEDTTCVRLDTGAVWCWGIGDVGQLGDGTNTPFTSTPVMVTGLSGGAGNAVVDIAVGAFFACASRPNGTVGCWGSDGNGTLGNGVGRANSNVPIPVPGLANVVGIEAGSKHVCAGTSNQELLCWGQNTQQQIQSGIADIESPVVSTVFSGVGANFSAGFGRSCLVLTSGEVECVGNGTWGSLGNGGGSSSSVAVLVTGTETQPVSVIDTHLWTSCAVGVGGDLRCWGLGESGELGNGESDGSPNTIFAGEPVSVVRAS